ncbi:MAG: glycosyltransferase [Candidatus Omnitrophica bacterium]|nr:glycosyltransferase [Candidatus Omnitrophota bacterium]
MISVCIPTYNRAGFLRQAIESVLAQTCQDFELIIVDNCSRDMTPDIVRGFTDRRVRYCRNAKNIGMSANWNRCLDMAAGEYVAVFHDDDIMLPENLAKKKAVLDSHPSVGIVHSSIRRIDKGGAVLGGHWAKKENRDYVKKGTELFRQILLAKNVICASSVLARRECYEKAGRFNEHLAYASDWEMWMRMLTSYDAAYLAEPLILYRVHPDMITEHYLRTKGLREIYRAKKNALYICRDSIPDAAELARTVDSTYKEKALLLAGRYVRQGRFGEALRSFLFFAGMPQGPMAKVLQKTEKEIN